MFDRKEFEQMLEKVRINTNDFVDFIYKKIDEDLQRLDEELQIINEIERLENEDKE